MKSVLLLLLPTGEVEQQKVQQQEEYLVHRMTFSPLAVREMFLAQTGGSGGGLGRGGAEEEVEREEATEVKMEGVTEEVEMEVAQTETEEEVLRVDVEEVL